MSYLRYHVFQTCFACRAQFFYPTDKHKADCIATDAQRSDSTVYCSPCSTKLATGELTTFEVFTGRKGHTF